MNLESASSTVSRSLKMRKTESETDEERPSCSTADVAESADPTEPKAFRAQRLRTVTLINLAAVMERMDEQILPALYNALGKAFNASPTELGYLTLARALVQALSSPLGGIAGHYYNRIKVTALGCVLWGVMTTAFGLCNSVPQGIAFWGINGIGLALVIPSGQSLVADYYSSCSRGSAFGALYLTGAVGGMLGSLFATNLGDKQVGGIPGWRFVFFLVASLSFLIGLCNLALGKDPTHDDVTGRKASKAAGGVHGVLKQIWGMCQIPTFALIIVQGIVGSVPWTALVFLTLYLQLLGMTDFAASVLMAVFLGSTALGGLLGGYVGDLAAARYPHHGRIFATQFSVFIGIPFTLLIFKGLPENGSMASAYIYGFTFVCFGLLKSWAGPCCNNPIFAEIVPTHMRTMVYAFDRCFEGALAACAAPLVGRVAESIFGFSGKATRTGDPAEDLQRARALGNALMLFLMVPWALCLVSYTGLHFTYKQDKRRAAREELSLAADQALSGSVHRPASAGSLAASICEDAHLLGCKQKQWRTI